MATTFLEPGGDADFLTGTTNGFWSSKGGSPVVATDFVHGSHIKSIKFGTGNNSLTSLTGIFVQAGGRISFYVYIVALPTTNRPFLTISDNTASDVVVLQLSSTGVLRFLGSTGSASLMGTGSTLSTGIWYRLSIAYTIASSSVNEFRIFKDGVLDMTFSNQTVANVGADRFKIGNGGADTSLDLRTSDHYVDDSTLLTDPGNIWVTAKRPNANGTTNGFSTQIGAGGSGYGTGHSPQVNERALSTTNGWSMVGAGSAVTEEYNIEGQSTGDINILGMIIIDYMGWVSASSLAGETASIIVNNTTSNISLTSTITLFKKFAGSKTYPLGTGTDIGIITATTLTTVSLYECGIVVAYIPVYVNDLLMMFR